MYNLRRLQCGIPFRCLKLQVLFDKFLPSLNRLSCHLSSVCPSVAKYVCTFPGSLTAYTCYTLVCSGFHRRSTQIPGWVFTDIWETLFTLLPWSAIAHSTVSPFAWEGHNWIGNQSPWSGSSDPFHRPAHSVAACFLRLPPFRGRWGRLGLGVFCPVLPVSLPFSRGSVSTLFDFTIYFHFNLFRSLMKLQSSRFQRSPFSLRTGLQIRCMYFL